MRMLGNDWTTRLVFCWHHEAWFWWDDHRGCECLEKSYTWQEAVRKRALARNRLRADIERAAKEMAYYR